MVISRKTNLKEELISVIVPVYNVEAYLQECLDSILGNTYRNLEIILVDDGSPDNCGRICDEYAEKDGRIRVIHQKNKGLVGARNAGLAAAAGEYVSFIDSDDAVSPFFYEYMMKAMTMEQADCVACEARNRKEALCSEADSTFSLYTTAQYEQMLAVITNAPAIRQITWTGCNVWNKLYKTSCIKSPFNPECLMCEDLRFNYDNLKNCKTLSVLSLPLYFYRVNPDGIMGTYRKRSSHPEYGICHARLWAELAAGSYADQALQTYLQGRALYMAHGALLRIWASGKRKEHQDYTKTVRRMAKQYFSAFRADQSSYSLRVRLSVSLLRYAFPLWGMAGAVMGLLQK